MLINARPRIVSHGFEAFVPIQRLELLHQRLVEMTNNDVNAWNFFRSVATPSDGWDQNLDDFSNSENFSVGDSRSPGFDEIKAHNIKLNPIYSEYCQDTTSVSQPQSNNLPNGSFNTSGRQVQCDHRRTISNSHSIPQGQVIGLNCVEKRSPMLATGFSHWNVVQRHGSFAEFSSTRNNLKPFSYQNLNESGLVSCVSAIPPAPQASYEEDLSMITEFQVDTISPSTAYSSYSSMSATVNPVTLMTTTAPNHQNALMKNSWCPDNSRSNKSQYQDTFGIAMLHDGLSKPQLQPQEFQQYEDPWIAGNHSSNDWATQPTASAIAPTTISPKALTLSVPSASFSTSESSQGIIFSLSDSSSASSSREDTPDSGLESLSVIEAHTSVHQHQQILPDSISRPRIVPILPSNDFASKKTAQKRPMKSKSEGHPRRRLSPSYSSKSFVTPSSSSKAEKVLAKPIPKRIEPKTTSGASWSGTSQSSTTKQAMHHRDAKDDFLVRSKLAGMSYKDIRRRGNFVEAESTLRGRFRTLTKHKAARVRKPEWTDNDIRLLKKAVLKLTSDSDPSKNKVPWKQVGEYILNNGGSYHFGNATCRKRWDELQ